MSLLALHRSLQRYVSPVSLSVQDGSVTLDSGVKLTVVSADGMLPELTHGALEWAVTERQLANNVDALADMLYVAHLLMTQGTSNGQATVKQGASNA